MIAKRAFTLIPAILLLLSLFGCQSKPALDEKAITDALAASGLGVLFPNPKPLPATKKRFSM